MSELAVLIQRQLPIGSRVKFLLTNGQEVSGMLMEIGLQHVTIEKGVGRPATVLVNMIGGWEVLDEEPTAAQDDLKLPQGGQENHLGARPLLSQSGSSHVQVQTQVPATGGDNAVVDPQILRRLYEIEARFDTKTQASSIDVWPPDLNISLEELRGSVKKDASAEWGRIKNKYEYAAKMNELNGKYGRIQPIVSTTQLLVEAVPTSAGLKRHLGYFLLLGGNIQEALKSYREASVISRAARDWYNVAALAIKNGNAALTCYSLDQVFQYLSPAENQDAWYTYIGLLRRSGEYPLLSNVSDTPIRQLSSADEQLLLEACIYLLKKTQQEATSQNCIQSWLKGTPARVVTQEALRRLPGQISTAYQQVAEDVKAARLAAGEVRAAMAEMQAAVANTEMISANGKSSGDIVFRAQASGGGKQLQGFIYTYKIGRNYGFLYGSDEGNYFFHRSAVIDEDLLERLDALEEINLKGTDQIPVTFESAQGPRGSIAVGVSLYRSIEETFALAHTYANEGEYPKAISQIRQVLAQDLQYPGAQEALAKWREYARFAVIPRGSNPYAHAKRVLLIEKDLERATELFYRAISENDSTESAIKDLAALLVRREKGQEAINVLLQYRPKVTDQQSLDNLLITVYQKVGQYQQAIKLLESHVASATNKEKKGQLLWQIANCWLKLEEFVRAEQVFREIVDLGLGSKTGAAQKNIAFCLIKQERYTEAEQVLNMILNSSPDAQAAELLEAVAQAKATGESARVDEILTESTFSDFSGEMTGFTRFFLDGCRFEGVNPVRVQEKSLDRSDVWKLEEVATRLGTRSPRDRAEYYLSAAKIISLLEKWDDPNLLYKYLCRSFASRGDAAVLESRPLDTARTWYCEALSVYDGDRSRSRDEQDAVNALVRYLYSTLGIGSIPIDPNIPPIDESLETIFRLHPQREKVFDAMAYLILRSRYAAHRLLSRLYAKISFQAMTFEYLKSKGVAVPARTLVQEDFVHLWNQLLRKTFDDTRMVSTELRLIAKVEMSVASLERSIERVRLVDEHLLFDLDRQRMGQLLKILETGLDLCKQFAFEEQERFCTQIGTRCQDLLREIEASPTKLSIEELYPIVESIQHKTKERIEEMYASSVPQLTLRLPEGLESYAPLAGDTGLRIEVQMVVANRMGCSPAESVELVAQEDADFYVVSSQDMRLDGSLRGGEQKILRIPLQVSEQVLRSEAFSLPVYAQYRTRSGETVNTAVENFSIRLYEARQFEEVENLYAAYAKGSVVGREMFYGRSELISNIANAIREAGTQSKSFVIFGQKRAGKSSILVHLREELSKDGNVLTLFLGDIGALLDEHSTVPLLYQILWSILNKLKNAVEDEQEKGRDVLTLSFPTYREFCEHPSPLILFNEQFYAFKRSAAKLEGWRDVRVVLLVDEFSYIYGQIVNGGISANFMKNWKALLNENFFSAVLVGQDVMAKFKQLFPNEFGTTQDVRISYLNYEDAVRLIDEPMRIGGKQGESRYREKAIERIVDLTAGNPFYIQILCNRLVEYMNRRHAKLVTEADVERIKNELVRGSASLDEDDFDNLLSSGDTSVDAISKRDAMKVLGLIVANSRTGPCSRNSIVCETQTPVDDILDDLVKRDVVECEHGQYYRVRVGLFKEWLSARQ